MAKKTKFRHNKKRNTAFLFETLVKELTKSVVEKNEERKQIVVDLIKEHFSSGTSLHKELMLYRALTETRGIKESVARSMVVQACEDHKTICKDTLFLEQTALIKKINKNLGIDCYSNFVANYKSLASISQMFTAPADIKDRVILQEAIVKNLSTTKVEETKMAHIDDITYSVFVKKFNEKYGESLLNEQREVLTRYIHSFSDNQLSLKMYLNEEVGRLKAKVEEMKADDDVATDSDMTESLTTVSDFLNSLKDEPIDENSLRRILKVQALVQEADNRNDNQD
mgnify:CR=1 FL=1